MRQCLAVVLTMQDPRVRVYLRGTPSKEGQAQGCIDLIIDIDTATEGANTQI